MSYHQDWKVEDWRRLFDEFKALQVSRLVLQWSVSADLAFYPTNTLQAGSCPPLDTILGLADESGVKVSVGLWHDPEYWKNIAGPAGLVEVYLRRAALRSVQICRELTPLVRRHPSFEGWYISEEVDDTSWNEPLRRKLILEHLSVLSADLRTGLPEAKVSVSGFSNARLDPESLAQFWSSALAGSSIDTLYFQDGIGTRKLELEYLPLYLGAVKRAAGGAGRTLGVVVEVFEQKAGGDTAVFKAVPASLSRIDRQIELAARYAGDRIVAFSLPDYMTGAAGDAPRRLLEGYMRKYIASGPRASANPPDR